METTTMLSDAFIDWWFSPWTYATRGPQRMKPTADLIAQRDAYTAWCAEAGVQAEFPDAFDPDWQVAALDNGTELRKTAQLFAGLVAARAQNQTLLNRLSVTDLRWCMSVAVTQPLKAARETAILATDPVEVYGLVDLASRLETGFPGMWTRLRLLLPEPLARRVDALAAAGMSLAPPTTGATLRAQRCWQMCRVRANHLAVS